MTSLVLTLTSNSHEQIPNCNHSQRTGLSSFFCDFSGWVWRLCFWTPVVLAVCVARQVTQSYLPRILEKRESELDAKARRIQSRIDAKLTKKATKKSSKSMNTTTSASVAKRKESESEKSL